MLTVLFSCSGLKSLSRCSTVHWPKYELLIDAFTGTARNYTQISCGVVAMPLGYRSRDGKFLIWSGSTKTKTKTKTMTTNLMFAHLHDVDCIPTATIISNNSFLDENGRSKPVVNVPHVDRRKSLFPIVHIHVNLKNGSLLQTTQSKIYTCHLVHRSHFALSSRSYHTHFFPAMHTEHASHTTALPQLTAATAFTLHSLPW